MDSKQVKAEVVGIFSTSVSTASRGTNPMLDFARNRKSAGVFDKPVDFALAQLIHLFEKCLWVLIY